MSAVKTGTTDYRKFLDKSIHNSRGCPPLKSQSKSTIGMS